MTLIDRLNFGRLFRPSIAHNLQKINEIIDVVNAHDDSIAQNADDIEQNAEDIAQNKADIEQNAADIAQNKEDASIYGDLSGSIVTADDAYSGGQIKALTIYGKSVQDGTPTPSAPVAIESVESLTAYVAGRNILDLTAYNFAGYTSVTVSGITTGGITIAARTSGYVFAQTAITGFVVGGSYTLTADLSDSSFGAMLMTTTGGGTLYAAGTTFTATQTTYYLRFYKGSASSGDTCTYSNVGIIVGGGTAYTPYLAGTTTTPDLDGHVLRSLPDGTKDSAAYDATGAGTYTQNVGYTTTAATDGITGTVGTDVLSSTGEIADGADVIYKLATPTTATLPTITMPTAPSSDITAWIDSDPSTTLDMTYRRDLGIVISNIEEAIASI